ncbi:P-loop containing nucleoside triphosphate hydrolase protein [Phanerochaete sordida]|uniref:DNA 3'-5' helicase n=1 Tax=Phanerochaete sordida TaxID=48140 RepID=A0A9P3GN22_9APHY|nr:P-loop containing nucleoside triphosphate hydrolase protein [Phanerochaete sordida]
MAEDTISLDSLDDLLREKSGLPKLEKFKLVHALDLCLGKDLFLVAPGESKIHIIAAPALVAQAANQSAIGFVVVPVKPLMEDHAKTLRAFGLRAVAINDHNLRRAAADGRDLWDEVRSGDDVRLAVVTSSMMQDERVSGILRNMKTKSLVRWVFLDEVQLFNESVACGYPPPYQGRRLEKLRTRLPSSTVFGAFAGSISVFEAHVIASDLGLCEGKYIDARYSLNPSHVKYVPRLMTHPTSGSKFYDLAWLIPFDLKSADAIPTTLIYCQMLEVGGDVMRFLDSLIPDHIPNRTNLIKLYSTTFSEGYRDSFQDDMKAGSLRVGICTDTWTYGLDIPNVRQVVVFGEIESYSRIKHAISQAGRDGSPATAYVYMPPWARDVPPEEWKGKKAVEDAMRRESLPPVIRDWFNAAEPSATIRCCPRQVDLEFHGEPIILPTDNCCSYCHPDAESTRADADTIFKHNAVLECDVLLTQPLSPSEDPFPPLEPDVLASITRSLEDWRCTQWYKICSPDEDLPSVVLLPSHRLNKLAERAHICSSYEIFCWILEGWNYLDEQGEALYSFLRETVQSHTGASTACTLTTP